MSPLATTGIVARRHDRDFIGIELSDDYARMARKVPRTRSGQHLPALVGGQASSCLKDARAG